MKPSVQPHETVPTIDGEPTAYSPDKEARLRTAIEKRFPDGSGPTSEILAFLAEFEASEKGGQA